MPWKVMKPMDLKMNLVKDWDKGYLSITDLSNKYAISRPTVYKWLKRYKHLGIDGLNERSRAPKRCAHRTSQAILDLVIQEKLKNRKRGPRKVRAQLKRQHPEVVLPAVSTLAYWLKKEGLVQRRKKRRHVSAYTQPFSECNGPNEVWSMDYKGQFPMKNGRNCYPLTVSDNYSRSLLRCQALAGPRYKPTKDVLQSAFREYGIPQAIRSDNGTPFAGKGIAGISRLSIWLIQQGIVPERIKKGCPQENGRHERMHRTLKDEVLDEVARNLKDQQKEFDKFRNEYNNERPHESLKDQVPGEYYKKSDRCYVENPHEPEYGYDYTVRRVRHNGEIKFKGRRYYIAGLLTGEPVGLKEIADGCWSLAYSFYALGVVDLRRNTLIRN
jgi:putative transposase